jgi:hypothetical protein
MAIEASTKDKIKKMTPASEHATSNAVRNVKPQGSPSATTTGKFQDQAEHLRFEQKPIHNYVYKKITDRNSLCKTLKISKVSLVIMRS